jgi:Tol biopolymer transport system component
LVRANSRDQKSYLFVAGADGSGERILAQADARKMILADSPSWSPDGKRIAVAAGNIGDEVYSSLLLVDMKGKSSASGWQGACTGWRTVPA